METRSRKRKLNCEEDLFKSKILKKLDDNLKIRPTNESPMIDDLDDDSLLTIFSYLTIKDLITIERVSIKWRELSLMSWINIKTIYLAADICKMFSLKNLGEILKRSGKYVTYLNFDSLHDYDTLPSDIISNINKYCRNLTHLNLDFHSRGKKDFRRISKSVAENLKSLHINIDGVRSCDKNLSQLLKKAVNLEEFSLSVQNSEGIALHFLTEKCKALSIRDWGRIRDETKQKALKKLRNLEHLHISVTSIGAKALESVSNQLVSFKLSSYDERFTLFKNNSYKSLSFDNLRILNLAYNTSVDDEVFMYFVEKCPLLEELVVNGCKSISSSSFLQLKKLKNLTRLDVGITNVTDDTIGTLGLELGKLKEVGSLRAKHVTASGLLKLIEFSPKLKILKIGDSDEFTREFFESAERYVGGRLDVLPLTITLFFPYWRSPLKAKDLKISEIARLKLKTFKSGNHCRIVENRWSFIKKFNENPTVWGV